MVIATEQKPISQLLIGVRKPSGILTELVVSCPRCKTLETLWFINGKLTQTRKFNQNDGHVYHDCGSQEPCHIYKML